MQNPASQGLFFLWTLQVKNLQGQQLRNICSQATNIPDSGDFYVHTATGTDYQDIEVHLRRQKSGFGFRVLGGDEAGQPVSPETREKARMAMGVEPCHFLLSNPLHTLCTPNP